MREQQQGRAPQGRAADGAASERENGSSNGGSEGGAGPSERGVDEGQDVYVSGGADKAGQSFEAITTALSMLRMNNTAGHVNVSQQTVWQQRCMHSLA